MSSQVPLGGPAAYQNFADIMTSAVARRGKKVPTNPEPEGPATTLARQELAWVYEKMLEIAQRGSFNFTDAILYKVHKDLTRIFDARGAAAGQSSKLGDASSSSSLSSGIDTSSFDYVGYLTSADLDVAARELGLKPGDFVLDVGSGAGHTMRYLHRKFGVSVVGVEKQAIVDLLAETLNASSAKLDKPHVRTVWMEDFLELPEDRRKFDSMISLLTMVHHPDRPAVFRKAARLLRMGATVHIQDYYARKEVADAWTAALIECVVHCPGIPTREQLIQELEAAGFGNIQFEDVSDTWQFFTWRRARLHRARTREDDVTREGIAGFYDDVTTLFSRGDLGGFRLTARLVKDVFGGRGRTKVKDKSGTASIAASEKKAQPKDDTKAMMAEAKSRLIGRLKVKALGVMPGSHLSELVEVAESSFQTSTTEDDVD